MICWFGRMRRRDDEANGREAQKLGSATGLRCAWPPSTTTLMGHDTIRTRQHGWMAGNETRADTHGRCREKKRASKPEDRLTPSRHGGVGCTAPLSPSAKHIPARMNLRGRGEHTCSRSAKARQIGFRCHPLGRLAVGWLRDAD